MSVVMEDIVKLRNLVILKGSVIFHKIEKCSNYTEEFDFSYINQLNRFIEKDLDAKTLEELLINGFSVQRKYIDNKLTEKTVIFFREIEW